MDKAAEVAFEEVMGNAGQCCVAATRTYVQAPIYDEMVEKFRQLAAARTLGDPFSTGIDQGPQVRVVPNYLNYPCPSLKILQFLTIDQIIVHSSSLKRAPLGFMGLLHQGNDSGFRCTVS